MELTKATKVMTYLPKRLLRPNHPKRDGKPIPSQRGTAMRGDQVPAEVRAQVRHQVWHKGQRR